MVPALTSIDPWLEPSMRLTAGLVDGPAGRPVSAGVLSGQTSNDEHVASVCECFCGASRLNPFLVPSCTGWHGGHAQSFSGCLENVDYGFLVDGLRDI